MFDLLRGTRILEFGLMTSSLVSSFLADAGADVIKIESPPLGDYTRDILGGLAPRHSPMHLQLNKNKRSLMVDLKTTEGQEILWRLQATADVFVDGFSVGAAEALGIGYEEQRRRKADIVYVQCSGFGATGPYASIPAHGRMMAAAAGKYRMEVCPDGFVRPTDDVEQVDGPMGGVSEGAEPVWAGAIAAAFYAAAALVRRRTTGQGARIDVGASEATVTSAWTGAIYALNNARLAHRDSMPSAAPGGPRLVDSTPGAGFDGARYFFYETKDGRIVLFAAVEYKFWEAFCRLVDRQDLIGTYDRSSPGGDFGLGDVSLHRSLRDIMLTRTRDEWLELAKAHRLPIGPVNVNVSDLVADPQLQERGVFVEGHHPHAGDFTYLRPPALVDAQEFEVARPAPLAGEHSTEILGELGYDGRRI
ncbi:MAG TPA: CoA transferase, partial [Acidimicrobiia bacterium]|nr:CoA transferase [Acidimicrobiia bacterium]